MQMNRYIKSFICGNQAKLFLYAHSLGLDIEIFIKEFMKSELCKQIDSSFSFWQTQPVESIFEFLVINKEISCKINKSQKINLDALEWLGFFYRHWHFLTGESSKQIIKFLPVKEGLKNWYKFHQLDENIAIKLAKDKYNISKNKHRKSEIKNSLENKLVESFFISGKGDSIYKNPLYFSFLAKRILYKLNKENEYLNLEYTFNNAYYDFVNGDKKLGLKTTTFSKNYKDDLVTVFTLDNLEAMFYKINTEVSIIFYFAYHERYQNEENLLEDIENLIKTFKPSERKYEYIYIYSYSKLYEINENNEINVYSLPLSTRERKGIAQEMKKYGLI